MDIEVRKQLEARLDTLLEMLANQPLLMDDNDRADIKLLVEVLMLSRLDRLVHHLENGQIAIIVP